MPIQIALDSLKQAASGTANSATFLRGDNTFVAANVAANSAIASPVFSGTAIGTYTLGGTPSLAATALTGTIAAARLPAGSVLQVVHTAKANTFSGTSVLDNGAYFIDVTGMSASITPSSTSSKILIMTTIYGGNHNAYNFSYRLKRTIGGTTTFPIVGTSEGGRPVSTGLINAYENSGHAYWVFNVGGIHQDSPNTTSAITYQVQCGSYNHVPAGTVYINRSYNFVNAGTGDYDNIPVSTITLMEIAG